MLIRKEFIPNSSLPAEVLIVGKERSRASHVAERSGRRWVSREERDEQLRCKARGTKPQGGGEGLGGAPGNRIAPPWRVGGGTGRALSRQAWRSGLSDSWAEGLAGQFRAPRRG